MYHAPLDGECGIPEEWWVIDAQAGCCCPTCIIHRHRKAWFTSEVNQMAQQILWKYWSSDLWECFPEVVPLLEQIREKVLIAAQVAEIPRQLQDQTDQVDEEDLNEPEQRSGSDAQVATSKYRNAIAIPHPWDTSSGVKSVDASIPNARPSTPKYPTPSAAA